MPKLFNALVYGAHPGFTKLPDEVIINRDLLKTKHEKTRLHSRTDGIVTL
ncbi:hypothetical protein [Lacihabitans sp. CS3-21]|nr:hypothetical protein [Lacihabitans sp. CS3-21]